MLYFRLEEHFSNKIYNFNNILLLIVDTYKTIIFHYRKNYKYSFRRDILHSITYSIIVIIIGS